MEPLPADGAYVPKLVCFLPDSVLPDEAYNLPAPGIGAYRVRVMQPLQENIDALKAMGIQVTAVREECLVWTTDELGLEAIRRGYIAPYLEIHKAVQSRLT